MKSVYQTIFGDGRGNCFAACIASILELPIEVVPNFCANYKEREWFIELNKWIRRYGVGVTYFSDGPATLELISELWPDAYSIVGGPTLRGPHAVVYQGARMIHDPHAGESGLDSVDDVFMFVDLDPSCFLRRAVPLREVQSRAFSLALRQANGRVKEAARILGCGRATLYRRLQESRAKR